MFYLWQNDPKPKWLLDAVKCCMCYCVLHTGGRVETMLYPCENTASRDWAINQRHPVTPPTPTPTDPRTGLLTFSTFYVFETTARVQHIHAAPFWRGCTVNQTHPTGSQVWKIKPPAGGRTAVGSRGPRSGTRPRQLSDLSSVFIQSKTSFIIRFEMITRHARIRAAWGRKSGETQIP